VALQEQLAAATAGEACDLLEAVDLPDRINAVARPESSIEVIALGNTWMAFTCIVGLMLFEWFVRKAVHLP
ncbi:MAG TPA: hypothetical protein VG713_02700, partial [Pirellulales bacterium]|nr:hypothetical protein [Pirellulales bacterium]